jgi:hypothetical protein
MYRTVLYLFRMLSYGVAVNSPSTVPVPPGRQLVPALEPGTVLDWTVLDYTMIGESSGVAIHRPALIALAGLSPLLDLFEA